MSVHPRSDSDVLEPDSKRPRPDPQPSTCSVVRNHAALFDGPTSKGLFAVLKPTLGIRAAEEPQVGITQFVDSTSDSFSGIIKHRFTDFLVYEIGLDGKVLRLNDIKGPETAADKKKKAKRQAHDLSAPAPHNGAQPDSKAPASEPVPEPPLWNDQVSSEFAPLLTAAKLDEFSQFVARGSPHASSSSTTTKPPGTGAVSAPPAPSESSLTTFTTSPIEDKVVRGKFHQQIRAAFRGKLLSAHKELEGGDVAIEVNWAKGNVSANKARQRGGGGRMDRAEENQRLASLPPYIHFTLLKLNKESHDAIQTLARYFNVTPRELGLAGTKDKRAITVQRVSLKRAKALTVDDVWRVARNGGGGGGGGRGGRGNAFVDRNVQIGDVEYADHALELGMLKGNKFVVTLRDIDPVSIPTIDASMESLRSSGFLNYYGMQRFGTAPIPTHLIGLALLRSEWELAVDLILCAREGEQQDIAVARGLWHAGHRDEARKSMPRRCTAERCVMEAYKKGNDKDHLGALSSIPKNLRLMYVHAWQSYIWNRLVSERVRLFGATAPVEGDLVYVGQGEQPGSVDDDAASAAVQDEAVVDDKSTDSDKPKDPSSAESQQAYYISTSSLAKVRPLTAADVAAGTHSIYDVVLPMPGFAVTYPGGQLGDLYRRVIEEDGIDPDKMWRKQKEYSLGGTYRKVVHLPAHVEYRLVVSTSPQDDLAQSDADVLRGAPVLVPKRYDPAETAGLGPGESLNLQVELELGSSTYATMAMREILKSRTSAANQKSLTKELEGRLEQRRDDVKPDEAEAKPV
ncbi:hypothetical protein JCM11491_001986 [Sporobolomyces phaffii]